jgi:hypothetical protein
MAVDILSTFPRKLVNLFVDTAEQWLGILSVVCGGYDLSVSAT